ncbi:MarR family winged helix-turn-helix transcriptional regulator [Mucilaginibacter sp. P25]
MLTVTRIFESSKSIGSQSIRGKINQPIQGMQLMISKQLRKLKNRYAQSVLKEIPGKPGEYLIDIITILSSATQPQTQKMIAELLELDKSRIAVIIDALNTKGYTYTSLNPADRREHFVFLTKKGQAMQPLVQAAIDKVNETLYKGMTTDQILQFEGLLVRLNNNLV